MHCDSKPKLQVTPTQQQATVIAQSRAPIKLLCQDRLAVHRCHQLDLLRRLASLLILVAVLVHGGRQSAAALLGEPYQLSGQVGKEAQLPCLVGKKANCGEPYIVAWYKWNTISKLWARIEHRSDNEPAPISSPLANNNQQIKQRYHLTWPSSAAAGDELAGSSQSALCNQDRLGDGRASRLDLTCAHLTIRSLEPADEGQYKCEITFSDSIDFDRCPANTMSQLNVIGK